ncbi:MAG TPA: hypothetical protein PLY87_01170 [Planctomycetaceae bacterium]|nr:hypothetical protein [Planctomycetaceae bacterium]HQZ63647.1 hypothetical protein [Planctomycetaceae bacterium]
MPVKLNIGLSRKVGEANYGSRGASINLEVELDNGLLGDPGQLRDRVRDLYMLARQSVDDELQRPADAGGGEHAHVNGNGHARHNNGHSSGNGNGHSQNNGQNNGHANGNGQQPRMEVARATQSQIRAIFAITKRQGLDANVLIRDRYRIHRMDDLSIREASALIDELKSGRTEARS